MVAQLSLHHLTALALSPIELIATAKRLGCSHVGLFTGLPPAIASAFPWVDDMAVEAVADALKQSQIALNNAEVFALRPGLELAYYVPSLARAKRLGARVATTHIHQSNEEAAVTALCAFADLCAQFDMQAALEFTSFSTCKRLCDALRLLSKAKHSNLVLALDALHFFRNQGALNQLAEIAPQHLAYVQLCDGLTKAPADLYQEAVMQRLLPGEGEFPLQAMVEQLPPTLFDVEVPALFVDRASTYAHVEKAVQAARKLMSYALVK